MIARLRARAVRLGINWAAVKLAFVAGAVAMALWMGFIVFVFGQLDGRQATQQLRAWAERALAGDRG